VRSDNWLSSFLAWRWAPTVGLVGGTAIGIAAVVLLVTDPIASPATHKKLDESTLTKLDKSTPSPPRMKSESGQQSGVLEAPPEHSAEQPATSPPAALPASAQPFSIVSHGYFPPPQPPPAPPPPPALPTAMPQLQQAPAPAQEQ